MKHSVKFLGIIFTSLVIWSCNNSKDNISISGNLKSPIQSEVRLSDMNVKQLIPVDSTKINEKGLFSLNISAETPSLYLLKVGPKSIYIILKPNDNINISIDNSTSDITYYVEGSPDSRLVHELITSQERVLDKITAISSEYAQSKTNPTTFSTKKIELDSLYNNLLAEHKSYTEDFIYSNPFSLSCIFALYQNFGKSNQPLFDKFDDFKVFNFVDSTLSSKYPRTPAVQALNTDVVSIKDQLKYKEYSEKLTEPGRKAPAFTTQTISGKSINLEMFSEKPVVFFFFAVWNKESVNEALRLNDIYKKYKYKGFKVIGISFDSSKEILNSFIEENNIEYPVISDYLYWESAFVNQFGIRKIPEIILLTPEHIIHNRNITSSELKLTLEEWRKNDVF